MKTQPLHEAKYQSTKISLIWGIIPIILVAGFTFFIPWSCTHQTRQPGLLHTCLHRAQTPSVTSSRTYLVAEEKKKKPTSEIPVWVPSVILQLLSSICFLPLPHSSAAFVKSPPKKREGFESSQQKKGSWNITEVTRHPTYCLCQNRFVFLTLQLQQDVHFLSLLQLLLHSLAKEERHHKSHISVDGF